MALVQGKENHGEHSLMGLCAHTGLSLAIVMSLVASAIYPRVVEAAEAKSVDTATREIPRAITHEDLWLMPRVGAASVSPDGRLAVFAVTEPAYERDEQRSDLWLVSTDSSHAPRRIGFSAGRAFLV